MSIECINAHIPSQGYQHSIITRENKNIIMMIILTKKRPSFSWLEAEVNRKWWCFILHLLLYFFGILFVFFCFFPLSFLNLVSFLFVYSIFSPFPFNQPTTSFCSQNDYLAETYLSHYSSPCKVSLEYGVFLGSQISPQFVYTFIKIASASLFPIWATNYMDIHAS